MYRLFYDIETIPNLVLTWQLGRDEWTGPEKIVEEAFVACIAWKKEGSKLIYSLNHQDYTQEEMIEKFLEVYNQADEVVTYNGDRFDQKWLRTLALEWGMYLDPFITSVDLYKFFKKNTWLNSYKFNYVLHKFLKEKKIPTGYDLWYDIAVHNSRAALNKMVKYCKHDVYLTEQAWSYVRPYLTQHQHAGVLAGLPKWSCPNCAKTTHVHLNKRRTTKMGTPRFGMICEACAKYFTISEATYRNYQDNL